MAEKLAMMYRASLLETDQPNAEAELGREDTAVVETLWRGGLWEVVGNSSAHALFEGGMPLGVVLRMVLNTGVMLGRVTAAYKNGTIPRLSDNSAPSTPLSPELKRLLGDLNPDDTGDA